MNYPKTDNFDERVEQVLRLEMTQSVRWFYLSFAEPKGWLGAIVIQAPGLASAIKLSHDLGINPGGQVVGVEMPAADAEKMPANDTHKLLSLDDCHRIFGKMRNINGEER